MHFVEAKSTFSKYGFFKQCCSLLFFLLSNDVVIAFKCFYFLQRRSKEWKKILENSSNFKEILLNLLPNSFQTQAKRITSASQVQSKGMSTHVETQSEPSEARRVMHDDATKDVHKVSESFAHACPRSHMAAPACLCLHTFANFYQCSRMFAYARLWLHTLCLYLPTPANACECLNMLSNAW